jgi:hypothetical protein
MGGAKRAAGRDQVEKQLSGMGWVVNPHPPAPRLGRQDPSQRRQGLGS